MLLQKLASYGANESVNQQLPAEVTHHAKRALLDWLAALFPGTQVSPGIELMRAHADEMGVGHARLIGYGKTTFPATAAWINGSVSHAVEFDDIYRDAVYHPGCPVIAAAIAAAETLNVNGTALINAIVVGYEISTRIGAAIQPSHYHYFHTTGTVGCMGAAAAAAALYAPGDATVMKHAIATATTFASGLQQAFRSDAMTKALHAGNAASVGVRSAMAAAAGVIGVEDILEGEVGFAQALAEGIDLSIALNGLGSDYNIGKITQKNHACCGHTFASIDAVLELQKKYGFSLNDIQSIQIETYRVAINVTGNANPKTAFEGKFSLPYVVAHALCFGSVRLNAFDDKRLFDTSLRQVMSKIHVTEDPSLSDQFPNHRSSRVTMTLVSGQTIQHYAPDRKGDPEWPLTDEELNNKFDELVIPVIGHEPASLLKQQIQVLENLQVRELCLG